MKEKIRDIYDRAMRLDSEPDEGFTQCAGALLSTDAVSGLAKYVQHDSIDRLQHITGVAYLTYRLCKSAGLEYETAAKAAVLHDLFYYDWHEKNGGHRLHGYRHPGFAVKNAKSLCGGLDEKTENIIKRHMWPLTPTPPKYKEGFILCFADKYCATRELIRCQKQKHGK